MTPPIKRAPTPVKLADAWVNEARDALKNAAGKDGRLTYTAAMRVGEQGAFAAVVGDNVAAYLERTGQKSVGVDKFIASERDRIVAEAAKLAGPGNVLSLAEATNLPQNLRTDYLALRGKAPLPGLPLTGEALKTAVKALVLAAIDDGSAVKLDAVPRAVRGRREVIEYLPHPTSNTHFRVHVAGDKVYASRASSVPSPLVGWYYIGKTPTP
jgi:hypothetical protein